MSGEKRKFALYLTDKNRERIDALYKGAGYSSRNDFINDAIWFYTDFLFGEKSTFFLPEQVSMAFKEELYSYDEKHNRMLFKMCVELAMVSSILTEILELIQINDDYYFDKQLYLTRLRGKAVEAVKHVNGVIKFENM